MYKFLLILLSLVAMLSACNPAPTSTPSELPTPMVFTTSAPIPEPIPTETPTRTTLSYESAVYRDEAGGFELDYPTSWTADPPMVGGTRGTIAQITSWSRVPGELPEEVPKGETILSITVLLWDPKNALDEFVSNRKEGWLVSPYEILLEEKVFLEGDWEAYKFVIDSPGGEVIFLLTTVGDRYLILSGSGDLEILGEMVGTLRPIQATGE